jgi:hypothetical protein
LHSGCSYINTAIDYIKEKGNVVSKMVQAPFKAIHTGKNV